MIIGIEGVSCVGKSRLAAELGRLLQPATVVPCYYHAVADPGTLPPIVAATPAAQLSGLRLLLHVETVRSVQVRAGQGQGRTIVLDRTVDTLLAHALAVNALMRFGIENAARALVTGRGAVTVPDLTLLLTAPFEVRRARAAGRAGMPELLYGREFTQHFLEHFRNPITPVCVRLDSSRPFATVVSQSRAVIGESTCAGRPVGPDRGPP